MDQQKRGLGTDVGLLALRLTVGGLLAGHGAQKLFGSFGGYGLNGTANWLETLGLRPGRTWALMAGGGELGSGALLALGLLHPLGSVAAFGPMLMAWNKVHAGKPIWVTSGGAELPLINLAAATALLLTGPGRLSLDAALGTQVPRSLTVLAVVGTVAGVAVGMLATPDPTSAAANRAGGELQAGEDGGEHGADTALGS